MKSALLTKPASIRMAIKLLYAASGTGLINGMIIFAHVTQPDLQVFQSENLSILVHSLSGVILSLLISLFLAIMIASGRDWARIALLGLFAIIEIPWSVSPIINFFHYTPMIDVVFIIQFALWGYALYLLFTQPGNGWFLKRLPPEADQQNHAMEHRGNLSITKPASIRIAIRLIYIMPVIGIINALIMFMSLYRIQIYQDISTMAAPLARNTALACGCSLFLAVMISLGKNWARIIFLLLMIASALFFIPSMSGMFRDSVISGIIYVIQFLLPVYALCLLFTKPGSDWFHKRSLPKTGSGK